MNVPILEKPMKGTEGDAGEATVRRSRPFLTILDSDLPKTGQKKRTTFKEKKPFERASWRALWSNSKLTRSTSPIHPFSLLRKEGRRLRSYTNEGTAFIAKRSGKGISSLAKAIPKLPALLGVWISKTGGKLAGIARKPPDLGGWFTGLKERLNQAKMPRAKAIKLAALGFAGLLTISVGANALVSARKFPLASSDLLLPDEDSVQASLLSYIDPEDDNAEEIHGASLPPIPVSVKISIYTVRSGDNLDRIAKRFGLRQDTIISANNLQRASSVHAGLSIKIPNMNGVSYKVRKGDSLQSIAKAYGADITRIADANDLSSGYLLSGQSLFIPNARLTSASLKNFYGEQFIWPARGTISSPFGFRENPFTGLRTFHSALDIVVNKGTKVKAVSDGSVADTGYNSIFGNYIILKHSSGFQSMYAHLSSILIHEGSKVTQGSIIGLSGNTGQSTGPHLHFSIFKNGQALDPRKYVK
ncbi:MAG: M23 family metallopeptidase [Spirochaetes bacterium]|nr:M23 family metallopeptidase [Spirochaetota bacterium]